jgi:hypothetical protein
MTTKYITNAVFLALTGVWVALVLACAWIPAYPVLGTAATITFSSILFSALTAPILGPLWGGLSGFVFGWLVGFVNPGAAFFGPLTFLTPMIGALMGGLVLFNRWKEATLIFCLEMVIWFLHPFAWYQAMPITTWQYWLVLAFIVIPPVRKWIVGSITSRNPAHLTAALWCLAWIALIGGDTATGNNIAIWIQGYGNSNWYNIWVPMTGYYAIAGALNCLAGATIGTAVLLALRRANLRVLAVDSLKTEK